MFLVDKMKKLIIIRHAKSSWKFDVIDHERPLNERGYNDANLVANKLKQLSYPIDFVLVSDAKRTTDTAHIILKAIDFDMRKVTYSHDLYDFQGINLTHTIKNCNNTIDTLLVFGHNHAITAFVNTYGSKIIDNVPTCGGVVIEFKEDNWSKITQGDTTNTIFPKALKD